MMCSEPDDFIRGMRFLFDAAAERLGAPNIGHESNADASSLVVQRPRIAARPV
jgi:hypothetical protein